MGYLDKLRQGSFRGFEFFIETSQVAGGRRAVQHQYPNRETPYTEDIGRQAKSYQIEGHIIGDNYFDAKEELFSVFEKKGPGELIHPYYGSLMVQLSALNVSESIKQGAIATFSVTFLELGNPKFPKGTNDKGAILSENKDIALVLLKADFDDKFSIAGLPEFAIKSARALIKKSQELFDEATKAKSDLAESVAELSFATRNLVAETNDLLQSPQKLSQRLLDSFKLMEDAISSYKDKTDAYKAFYAFEKVSDIDVTTPTRIQEADNAKVYENFMRRASAVNSTTTASFAIFDTIDDAHTARQEITAVLEEQIREIPVNETNTELLQSFNDVNASIVDALPDADVDLPSIKTITPIQDTNTLVLSYDLNEKIDNEQDIIARNSIRHPAFVGAQDDLEVINGN